MKLVQTHIRQTHWKLRLFSTGLCLLLYDYWEYMLGQDKFQAFVKYDFDI